MLPRTTVLEKNVNLQLVYLFYTNFVILFVGMGLFPILPVYASSLGAAASMVGLFFALMYLSNAMGPMLVNWLTERVGRKKLFVISGALGTPALALLWRRGSNFTL